MGRVKIHVRKMVRENPSHSDFGKALQYGSTKAVRILLFTSF
jgi:hypothetical protein